MGSSFFGTIQFGHFSGHWAPIGPPTFLANQSHEAPLRQGLLFQRQVVGLARSKRHRCHDDMMYTWYTTICINITYIYIYYICTVCAGVNTSSQLYSYVLHICNELLCSLSKYDGLSNYFIVPYMCLASVYWEKHQTGPWIWGAGHSHPPTWAKKGRFSDTDPHWSSISCLPSCMFNHVHTNPSRCPQ